MSYWCAGLVAGDVVVLGNSQYIKFRPNRLHKLNKKSLSRSVPIAAPLLNALWSHTIPTDHDAALCGKYGPVSSHYKVLQQLRGVISGKMGLHDHSLIPYSTRHTIKDRGGAARVGPEIVDYMQGYVTSHSSKIAQNYGTGLPPEALIEDLGLILGTDRWGDNT